MADQGPTAEELEFAKKYVIGAYAINNLDSSAAIARTLVQLQMDHLGIDYIQRRVKLINDVTLDDVTAVAKRLLTAEPAVMLVGPKASGGAVQ
jgi:zinc protease